MGATPHSTLREEMAETEREPGHGHPPRREQDHHHQHHHRAGGGGDKRCNISMHEMMPRPISLASPGGIAPTEPSVSKIINTEYLNKETRPRADDDRQEQQAEEEKTREQTKNHHLEERRKRMPAN